MQENKFENQIRGLMDELEIAPSAPVWDYVEKRIPKSNRRRRFIAFFLLFAGFAVCGYFFYHKFYAAENMNTKIDAAIQQDAIQQKKDSTENLSNIPITRPGSSINNQETFKKEKKLIPKNTGPLPLAKSEQIKKNNSVINNTNTAEEIKISAATIVNGKPVITEMTEEIQKKKSTNQIEENGINENAIMEKPADTIKEKTIQELNTVTPPSEKNDTVKQNKAAKKTTAIFKKLQWGITAFYGKVDAVQQITDLNNDKSYVYDGSLNSVPGGRSRDSIIFENQSKNVKARSAFSIGIAVRKPLSSRSSITTGLEFMRLNSQIQTGGIKDSAATFNYNNSQDAISLSSFYQPGAGNRQINKYTLLQVPVVYSCRLNKNKNIPITIDAGVSVSHIITSNALLYDSYNLAYYKNEDLLRKTQINLMGGFNIEFISRNKSSLNLGPQFQYGLTGIIKNNNSNQHFFIWGLRARYFLKK